MESHGSWLGVQTSAKQAIQMPLDSQGWSLQKLLGHLIRRGTNYLGQSFLMPYLDADLMRKLDKTSTFFTYKDCKGWCAYKQIGHEHGWIIAADTFYSNPRQVLQA